MRLASVWYGNDTKWLQLAIPYYLGKEPHLVVDVTYGQGGWWERMPWPATGLDIAREMRAPILGDFTNLPLRSGSIEVLVFDPPHRSSGGTGSAMVTGRQYDLYGVNASSPTALIPMLWAFFPEAERVLVHGGIVLCKITDQIHWHYQVWHHVEAINAGRDAGLCACDLVVKARPTSAVPMRWVNAYHALKHHSYWLIFRKGKCEPKKW